MMSDESGPLKVAILGGGPSGCALGILLRRLGAAVTLFEDGRRPPLVVGESLIPAVIPSLRRLGVEERTAAISTYKPGASFSWSAEARFAFVFSRYVPTVTGYAYNIPRPAFDEMLLQSAVEAGVDRVHGHARLEVSPDGQAPELRLAAESLALAPSLGGREPDLIVDATGRTRQSARLLGIRALRGPRNDLAHFAHFEGFHWPEEEPAGQVLIARLRAGWCWRISLPGCLSAGIVVPREQAERLGATSEERLERAIAEEPVLTATLAGARRATPVATYSNYQLISDRGYGPGWVAVGDAFGFVDPMLSPGVCLALRSAERVADALAPLVSSRVAARRELLHDRPARLFAPYIRSFRQDLSAWMDLVAYLYDGRLAALMRSGADMLAKADGVFARALERHIDRNVALQACGVWTSAPYSRGLLRFMSRHGLRGFEPDELAVR
jgi:flavin-dependent dehydrogenase